ncbi:hypothetical protein ACFU8I_11790 [Streptomyces sp. NPDC057540]|uniref:hypothetical protein n=1 Tax=Streptomyces sp. NPDC057540 TaxID=3346160 RepID=UPI0036C3EF6D
MPIAIEVHSEWGCAAPSARHRSGGNVALPGGGRDVALDEDRGREGLRDAVRLLDHLDERADPLLTGVLLPCRIDTLTEELLRETASAARRRDGLVHLHALQGSLEGTWSGAATASAPTPPARLDPGHGPGRAPRRVRRPAARRGPRRAVRRGRHTGSVSLRLVQVPPRVRLRR